MLTEFGKLCRKIRIDNSELLKDMAAKLEVTAAYLSAVECGKRSIPDYWPETIAKKYSLDKDIFKELKTSAVIVQLESRIKPIHMEEDDKNMVVALARKLTTMSSEEKSELAEKLIR